MREKLIIDHGGLISVAPDRMPWPGGRVLDHGDLEALLNELAQMRLDAHIGQHAAEDDLGDSPLAQLQHEVVGLRPEHLVRADDDRLAVVDVRLEAIEPIRARVREAGEIERSGSRERVVLELVGLERSVHLPAVIGRIEIMRRDEDLVPVGLRGLEDLLHVLDRAVLADAGTERQFAPVSLSTSFCGSMNTIAVSVFRMSMAWCSCPVLERLR